MLGDTLKQVKCYKKGFDWLNTNHCKPLVEISLPISPEDFLNRCKIVIQILKTYIAPYVCVLKISSKTILIILDPMFNLDKLIFFESPLWKNFLDVTNLLKGVQCSYNKDIVIYICKYIIWTKEGNA